ncbi:DUF2062 domain-containing protein [Croceicoccus sp. BE223]|uniref:DUF2062 domain-containing protein n=1 Tax=Croceicoccus sp. BE223 TaxID=2817716 RepID=UPI00285F1BAF|nr:DUF2062 domain-containing protein [Croceicoccus sp. BE223]MDR7103503.1 uncharacterized protein (DUF2062 family) [Croceicoccus sp. BE223]
MPTREQMEANRFIRPYAHRVLRSELWRFTRRSVPRGVALGIAAGIIIPLGQIFVAAMLALPFRANVPVAAALTFVTNPITTPLVWLFANWLGSFLLRIDEVTRVAPVSVAMQQTDFDRFLEWLTGETLVTAFGLVALAVFTSALGYLVSGWIWRWIVARKRTRMIRARRERLDRARHTEAEA